MLFSSVWSNPFGHGAGDIRSLFIALFGVLATSPLFAQTVTATVNANSSIATLPEYGMGVHSSVYDGGLRYEGSPVYSQLDSALDEAGVNVLRYPGGGYADIFHFSTSRSYYDGGLVGHGFTPWWGEEGNYGWMSGKTDFGNFVKLLDATNSKTIITLNTGGALEYDNPSNPSKLVVPSHGGQPQEAAAWVAYANAEASIYGTPSDIALGIDAEGNDWKTAGYWAKLRASTPSQYSSWAAPMAFTMPTTPSWPLIEPNQSASSTGRLATRRLAPATMAAGTGMHSTTRYPTTAPTATTIRHCRPPRMASR